MILSGRAHNVTYLNPSIWNSKRSIVGESTLGSMIHQLRLNWTAAKTFVEYGNSQWIMKVSALSCTVLAHACPTVRSLGCTSNKEWIKFIRFLVSDFSLGKRLIQIVVCPLIRVLESQHVTLIARFPGLGEINWVLGYREVFVPFDLLFLSHWVFVPVLNLLFASL